MFSYETLKQFNILEKYSLNENVFIKIKLYFLDEF